MTTLHATPYSIDATGFYFENTKDYEDKAKSHYDKHGNLVEEFEIQYIDGEDAQLFEVCGINQTNLTIWFDQILVLQDYEKVNLYYLVCMCGYELIQALQKLEDPSITESSLQDASEELFDECWLDSVPENIRFYIDYDKFARDCRLSGDLVEFEFNNKRFTCTNAAGM